VIEKKVRKKAGDLKRRGKKVRTAEHIIAKIIQNLVKDGDDG